jgi:DNA-binding NarL/FixJ family response regulator
MIRVVIADDHELIRVGVKKILRSCKDVRVVGEAIDLAQAMRMVRELLPDLLVLDISLPGADSLQGLHQVRAEFPALPVLILSMYPEDRFAIPALKAGAAGYITKSMAADELVRAIRKIEGGGSYVSPRVADLLARDLRQVASIEPHEPLTERERQVVALIGAGKPAKQVAAELDISVSSVNTYRSRISRKVGVRGNAGLIRYALKHGLVDGE